MEEAASIPLVGLTAWQALIEKANLKKGQKIFIQAGSGGVGTFAIQLAKSAGATVATTTSTENIDLVKRLGADVVIDYKNEDFENVLKDYDVVLNSQDAKTLEKSLRVLRPGGKLISISGPLDPAFANEIGAPWFVKLVIRALSYGTRSKAKRRTVTFSLLFMKASGSQLRRSHHSLTPESYARSWTVSFRSQKPTRQWLTSKPVGPKARLSSRLGSGHPAFGSMPWLSLELSSVFIRSGCKREDVHVRSSGSGGIPIIHWAPPGCSANASLPKQSNRLWFDSRLCPEMMGYAYGYDTFRRGI